MASRDPGYKREEEDDADEEVDELVRIMGSSVCA